MEKIGPLLEVWFYKTDAGNEPVRGWLKSLPQNEKKVIGEDIKTVQFGWPIGMPLVGSLGGGLYETRSELKDKIARIIFALDSNKMILLHGFIKKGQKIPLKELNLAKRRWANFKKGGDKNEEKKHRK